MTNTPDLQRLHEAATPADPHKRRAWDALENMVIARERGEHETPALQRDFRTACDLLAPSFVALRNAYATGSLIPAERYSALVEAAEKVDDCRIEEWLAMLLPSQDIPASVDALLALRAALKEVSSHE